MDIAYRDYVETADLAGQRQLFRLSFPEVAGTEVEGVAHYRWKFADYPAPVPSYAYVGEDQGTLIGYYAAIPYRYQIDGQVHVAGMVCDVMTHPQWRGKGVFTGIGRYSLQRMAEQGIAFTTGYPIRPEVLPGHLKVGWKVVQQMPMRLRPVGIGSFLPGWLRPLSRVVDPVLRGLQKLAAPVGKGYRTEVHSRAAFLRWLDTDPRYARFLAAWLAGQPNALIKDADFLAWRTGAPGTEYHFACLHHGDALVGVALARPTLLKGVRTLAVLDFTVLPSHHHAAPALHQALLALAIEHRTDVVACMMSQQWAAHYRLARCLYVRTPYVFSLIAKRIGTGLRDEQVYDASRWHLGWIDSDDL
ncbi:GNAT family N-acetyltransferase [Stenotrophomonas rhizophila]